MNRNQERIDPNAPRFDLYLDIEGVLFGQYDGENQLRPAVNTFLKFCIKYFYCKWLTATPQDRVMQLFRELHCNNAVYKIEYITWGHLRSKVKAIDFMREFLWIEDEVDSKDRAILISKQLDHCLIEVDPTGKDALYEVMQYLKDFLREKGYIIDAPIPLMEKSGVQLTSAT